MPTMTCKLTDTSATLTFDNPPQTVATKKANRAGADSQTTLAAIESKLHPKVYEKNFIRHFTPPNNAIIHNNGSSFDSAFAAMADDAFGSHKAIELRPDDLHLLILQGISRFVTKYPEQFRNVFVEFQGKKKLMIQINNTTDKSSWEALPAMFSSAIQEIIKLPSLIDVLMQEYSESTAVDRTVKAITVMGTFSSYFKYTSFSLCFIPEFILKGTVSDWNMLASLPAKIINELNLQDCTESETPTALNYLCRWLTRLQPVLHHMYQARTGVVNTDFWLDYYKIHCYSWGTSITGNIIYFYPFLKKGTSGENPEELFINRYILDPEILLRVEEGEGGIAYGPSIDHLTSNLINVDMQLEEYQRIANEDEDDDEPDEIAVKTHEMAMKAGIVAYKESLDQKPVLSTHVDFSIFFKGFSSVTKKKPAEMKEDMNNAYVFFNSKGVTSQKDKGVRFRITELDENDKKPVLNLW